MPLTIPLPDFLATSVVNGVLDLGNYYFMRSGRLRVVLYNVWSPGYIITVRSLPGYLLFPPVKVKQCHHLRYLISNRPSYSVLRAFALNSYLPTCLPPDF